MSSELSSYSPIPFKEENFGTRGKTRIEEENDQLTTAGLLIYSPSKDWNNENSIYIEERVSYKPGFGTASMRKVFKESLELGYEGRIHNEATWSSHLFHLYMGMIPCEKEVSYVHHHWGQVGEQALKAFKTIKQSIELNKKLGRKEQSQLEILKEILSEIKNIEIENIKNEMILEAGQVFEEIQKKTISYLKEEFIPEILGILEKNISRRPNSEHLTSVNMILSKEGIARWKEAVVNNIPFTPFKRLEHLRSFMKPEDLKLLDTILDIREKILGKGVKA